MAIYEPEADEVADAIGWSQQIFDFVKTKCV